MTSSHYFQPHGPLNGVPACCLSVCFRNTTLLEEDGPRALREMGWLAAELPGRVPSDFAGGQDTPHCERLASGDTKRRCASPGPPGFGRAIFLVHLWGPVAQTLDGSVVPYASEACVAVPLPGRGQLAEIQRLLDSDLRLCQRARLSDVQQGWQVAECGSKAVNRALDLQSCRLKNGRAWVKFLDAESETVRPSRQESEVAEFFLRATRLQSPVHLAVRPGKFGPAAADAFATGGTAGIGGWFLPEGLPLAVSSIIWFSISLDARSLPDWFAADGADLETKICALVALAQLVLLVMQVREAAGSRCRPNVGCIALRQQSDNLGVVCLSAKGLSMKEPLASILQATAVFCTQEHLNLRISHLAGSRNCWADALSRGASHDAAFWSQLSPARRRRLDWRSIMQAGRPGRLSQVKLPM